MRKSVLTIGLLTVLLAMGSVAQANIISNGDMELGGPPLTVGVFPDDWTFSGSGRCMMHTNTATGTGYSAYLRDDTGVAYANNAYQLTSGGAVAGEEYTFSFSYSGNIGVRAYVSYVGLGTAYANNFAPSAAWTDVTVNFTAPATLNDDRFEVVFYTVGGSIGDLFIDDVVLTPEPMTMGLLGMGGVLCLFKKRFRK